MKSIRQNQLEILFKQSDRVLIGSFLVTATTGWVLWNKVNNFWLFLWVCSMIFFTSARGTMVFFIRKKSMGNYEPYAKYFIFAGSISGFTLGMTPYLVPYGFTFEIAYIFIITIAMMAGAVSALSSYLPAFYTYFFSLYIPFTIRIIASSVNSFPDDKYMIGITFLFILTTPILVLFGINIHNWIKENLAMLHEKQILAKKLQNDQEKLHLTDSALNNVNEGIIITTANMEIIYANEAFTRISGFTYEEVKGKPPEIFQSTGLNHRWSLSEKNGKWEGEVWNKRKDGQTYPALFNVIPMKNDLGQIKNYIIHFKDITDKKKQEDELRYFANFDDLTGLPNRKHIYDRLDIILNNKLENNFFGSILFLDINYFKIINDVYGHQTGDLLLKAVSERLKENLREDDMVGRLGGDEFVVILKNTGKDESIQISEKLIETISTPFYINDKKCNIGLSIGIALIPEHGSDRRTLMHHADTAMYQAKLQNESTHWVIFKETAKV